MYAKLTKEDHRKPRMTSVVVETLVIWPFLVRIFFSMYYVAFRDYRSSFCIRAMFISLTRVRNVAFFFGASSAQGPKKAEEKKQQLSKNTKVTKATMKH